MTAAEHPTLEETAAFAGTAHGQQMDQAGTSYIGHLARVSRHLLRLFPDATLAERHAAWLHDVLEDTPTTAADLAARGYDPAVIAIVAALTKAEDGRSYQQRIVDLAATGFVPAMRVKLADLADNSDPARLAQLPPDKAVSLGRRYAQASETLQAALARHTRLNDDDDLPYGAHLQITLTIEPVHYAAYEDAARIAKRTVERFIVEESLFLAEMLIAAGHDSVPLARDRLAKGAPVLEAFALSLREHRPIEAWGRALREARSRRTSED